MIKVAVFAPIPRNIENVTSGVPRATIELVKSLRKYCKDLEIICITLNSEVNEIEKINSKFGDIYYLPTFQGRTLSLYIPDIIKLIRFVKVIKPDIIHSQGFPEYILAGELSSFPHVATLHGIILREAKTEMRPFKHYFRALVRGMMEQYYIRNLKNIISISKYIDRYLANISHANIYNIDNPIDEKYYSIKNKAVPGYILQVGSLVYRKGAHILVEAVGQIEKVLQPYEIHFVGAANDKHYLDYLKNMVKKKKLEDIIYFHGTVSDDQLHNYYSKASIVCLPSFEETSPLSIAQAMAAGKIVVASRSGGNPDIIKEGETGLLFNTGSSKDLAKVLQNLLTNCNDYIAFPLNAKKDALSRFHPEMVAQKTHGVYETVVGRIKI